MNPLDFSNRNTLWGSVVAETLFRLEVDRVVICPGSRSAPLACALSAHPGIYATPVLDERAAGFFALGLVRATGRPTVLVCTSGTAAANFMPAVIEARESGVPLLVCTADRPPELRRCRAGQAIVQVGLYGTYPVWDAELPVPEAKEGLLAHLRQVIRHAVLRTRRPIPGPVHLNFPFRDPLAPIEDGSTAEIAGRLRAKTFFANLRPVPAPSIQFPVTGELASDRGVIVAGPAQPADPVSYSAAVGRLARGLGWPVLADGLSPVRHHNALVPGVIAAYDSILRNPLRMDRLKPDRLLLLEEWPASRRLREWVGSLEAPIIAVGCHGDEIDATRSNTETWPVSVEHLVLPSKLKRAPDAWRKAWSRAELKVRRALDAGLRGSRPAFEGRVARIMAEVLPGGTAVFAASSMPVRDFEFFWPSDNRRRRFFFNRGANGIDGTVSTALGVAQTGIPTVLLTGDLAFLHDINGLLLRPEFQGRLTILVVNNRGGGIFNMLPIAGFSRVFERFFATPQDVDLKALCRGFGVRHHRPANTGALRRLLRGPVPKGLRVIEWLTDRRPDAEERKRILDSAG